METGRHSVETPSQALGPYVVSPLPTWSWTSQAPSETVALGERLGAVLAPGSFLALDGPLGAGKTTFCRGLGRGLAVKEPLASPTYLLCREYTGRHEVLHFDAYFQERLDSLFMEGLAQEFRGKVVLMEWAEKASAWLLDDRIQATLEPGQEEEERRVTLTATGPFSEKLLNQAFGAPVLLGTS
jgi:tRNA threonylcarbamoyladenosine biosynthesis protein TsaE